MSDNIIQLNEQLIKTELKELVRSSVEESLNLRGSPLKQQLLNAIVGVNALWKKPLLRCI